MVYQYHRSWRKSGGDSACASHRGADCGLTFVTDHGEIVKVMQLAILVPQITEEVVEVCSWHADHMDFLSRR